MAIFISFVPVLALAIGLAAIVRPADRLQLIDAPTLAFAGFAVALTAFGRLTERGEAASSWAAVTLALAFIQAITATTLLVNHNRYIPTREQAEYAMDVALGPASRPTDSKSIGQLYDSFNNIKHLAEPIGSGWVAFCAAVAGISLLLLIALWQTKQAIATLVSKR
jgi:divalent metal cation (Fe/Co/Zn/Cd) transporter